MEGVSFQAGIDPRLIGRMRDSAEAQSFIDQQWRRLNDRMGRYIADNLSAEVFQLIRIRRDTQWNNGSVGNGLLTITLEVGQVTERPFVTVAVQEGWPEYSLDRESLRERMRQRGYVDEELRTLAEINADNLRPMGTTVDDETANAIRDRIIREFEQGVAADLIRRSQDAEAIPTQGNDPTYRPLNIRPETTCAEIEAQRTQPVAASMFRNWNEYAEAVLETERRAFPDTPPAAGSGVPGGPDEAMRRFLGGNTPPAQKPDPVPHKRHILIDKKNPPPENTP